MAAWYPWIVLVHLACAIVFVGAAVFEVLILDSLHRHFDKATMQRIESAVMDRARRVMPAVVLALFASGALLFRLRCGGTACLGTSMGAMLLAKVALALGVLAVFVQAVWAGWRGRMHACRFRRTHRIVVTLMAGIVILAKTMFYV